MSQPYPPQHGRGRPLTGPQHGYPQQAPARPVPRQRPQQTYAPPPAPVRPAARPAPEQPARNGFGITALVLALVGIVFGLVPLTGFIALILGMLAVVFGLLGLGRARKGLATNGKMSGVSTLLGVGVAALGIWGIVILFQVTDQFVNDMDQIGRDLEQSTAELDAYNECVRAAGTDLDKMNACELPS